jgi:hypothetical protein
MTIEVIKENAAAMPVLPGRIENGLRRAAVAVETPQEGLVVGAAENPQSGLDELRGGRKLLGPS